MLIKNGMVFILKDKGFVKKDILVEGSKIVEVSDTINGDKYVDAEGKYITPGLIDGHSHIGICEEGLGWEGDDLCEYSDPILPELRALDGVNPMDIAFKEALSGGVTVACVGPGSANVISGQFATIKLHGNIIDNMIIKETAAIKCSLGENPKEAFGKSDKLPMTRMGIAMLLRETLINTINYKRKKDKAIRENDDAFEIDIRMESMLPVINREIPLKVHCHRADDITTAIRIAKEFNIKITLDHCTEGYLIVDYLKNFEYPVFVGPSFGSKSKIELKNKSFINAKVLNDAGLKISIITDHNVLPQQSLIMCAALAVKEGLSEFDAMKAITINPAEMLCIDDIKGEIKEGKDGDLVIWNKYPFDIQGKVEKVFIEGEEVYSNEGH